MHIAIIPLCGGPTIQEGMGEEGTGNSPEKRMESEDFHTASQD